MKSGFDSPWDHKTKKFPYNHIFGGGVWGGAGKKWKGYFFVLRSPHCFAMPPNFSIIEM